MRIWKKLVVYVWTAAFILQCSIFGPIPVMAADEKDAAEAAVAAAEESQSQQAIDTAQVLVSGLLDGAGRTGLEERLDALQSKVDAVLYVDYSDKLEQDTFVSGDNTSGTYVQESGNLVAKISLTATAAGGWGPEFTFSNSILQGVDFTVEQKVKYSGSVSEGRVVLYAKPNNEHIFNFYTAGQIINSGWNGHVTPSPVMAADTWYTIRYAVDLDNSLYTITVLNTETEKVLGNASFNYTYAAENWTAIQYQFNGSTPDATGALYIDDLIVTPKTPLKIARDAVVKAERSLLQADVAAAQQLVGALEEDDAKVGLQKRLNAAAVFAPAATAVAKAEQTRLQMDIDEASRLLGALEECNQKTNLAARLESIQVMDTEEAAQLLVETAERTREQSDIDQARQVLVQLPRDTLRTALDARLDMVQAKVDAVYMADYTEGEIGDDLGYNGMKVAADPDGGGNLVAASQFSDTAYGGWSPECQFTQPVTGKFILRQKVRWGGSQSSGREFALYARTQDNTGILLYTVSPSESGGIMFVNGYTNIAADHPLENDTWYDIVFEANVQTKEYDVHVTNLKTQTEVITSLGNVLMEDGIQSFRALSFILKGQASAGVQDCYFYMDDFSVTPATPLIYARNAVVKAEQTGLPEDMDAAQRLLEALADGGDKAALQQRLDNLADTLYVGPVVFQKDGKNLEAWETGTIAARVRVNNQGDLPVSARLYAALYQMVDGNERLSRIAMSDIQEVSIGAAYTLQTELSVSDVSDGDYTLRAFVWDTTHGIAPLSQAASLTQPSTGLQLPNFFTKDMVLQRGKSHVIWGKGVEGRRVQATLYSEEDKEIHSAGFGLVENGQWKVSLAPLPYGGPYVLEVISGAETKRIDHVYVGDVFLLAGQSNMEFTYWPDTAGIQNPSPQAAIDSGMVKFFATEKISAQAPTFDIPFRQSVEHVPNIVQSWATLDDENAIQVSQIGMYFAQELLQEHPDVPVGLMCVAWGGTDIQSWVRLSEDNKGDQYFTPSSGAIFNNHVAPLVNYQIAGILWYQGENDWNRTDMYSEAFPILIDDYRRLWGCEDLPFFYVQLARFDDVNETNPQDLTGIREEQRKALDRVENPENVGMVVSLDTDKGTYYDIHPAGKEILAHRLFLLAQNLIFGEEHMVCSGPLFESAAIKGDKIVITFRPDTVGSGLMVRDLDGQTSGGKLQEFEVCGPDGVFVPADAEINGNAVEVMIPGGIENPAAVRYAISKVPANPNLYNQEGLPASGFAYTFEE